MKILIVSSEFPPGPGGIGAHAYNLALQLVNNGNEVSIYTADRPTYSSVQFDRDLQFMVYRYPIFQNKLVRSYHLVKILLREHKSYDWVILSGLTNLVLYNFISIILKARFLCIVHGHEIIMAKGMSVTLVRKALMNSNCVVAVSDFSKNILHQNGITRQVTTIPNGVNVIKGVKPKTPSINKLILITVGSVTRRKGQHNIVAALPAIIKRFVNVEYHIVGIPRQKEEIKSLSNELGVANHIFLHGVTSEEQRNALLARSDIFMLLSENLPDGDVEGFGIAVLEANAFGLPAIGSKGTGVEQAINKGKTGFIVDAHNPNQICDSIELIMKKYEKFSEASIVWANRHDWAIIGERYISILTENHS